MITNNFYDIVIVGAGIPGLTLASQLANTALTIAVVDKQLPILNPDELAALRVSAITPASKKILANLDLWQTDISAFTKMHVWTPEGSYLDFSSVEVGEPALGYIIPNHLIQTSLYQSLKNSQNINFITGQLQSIHPSDDGVTITTDTAVFNAALLIGADGANSLVRKLNNIDLVEQDYHHNAIVATVKTELPHQQTAWQCFLPTGPLAFLPLLEAHTASIVWSTNPAEAERLLQLNDEMFRAELAKAFSYRLGSVSEISQRLSFPLHRRHAKQYVTVNVALIGDAAHTIHPLAGQGLNLGILDANCLAKIILSAHQQKRKINSLVTLRKYERARKADNALMFSVVDGIKRLFDVSGKSIKLIRNTGMSLVNNLEPIKRFLIKQAIGMRE